VRISDEVSAEELEPLAQLPGLRVLRVGGLSPGPKVKMVFQRMTQLRVLELSSDLHDAEVAVELHSAFPNLQIWPLFKAADAKEGLDLFGPKDHAEETVPASNESPSER
jgi:hypothetical protein